MDECARYPWYNTTKSKDWSNKWLNEGCDRNGEECMDLAGDNSIWQSD